MRFAGAVLLLVLTLASLLSLDSRAQTDGTPIIVTESPTETAIVPPTETQAKRLNRLRLRRRPCPPLYGAGVDVVLAGHDHHYGRFDPQTPAGARDTAFGIREFIVGRGGRSVSSLGTIKPNSVIRNTNTFGVIEMTLRPGGYDWQFVPIAGSTSGFTDSGSASCHDAPTVASSAGGPTTQLARTALDDPQRL